MITGAIRAVRTAIRAFFVGIGKGIKRLGWTKLAIGVVALVVLFWIFSSFGGGEAPVVADNTGIRTVEVQSVAILSSGGAPLSVAGTVSSQSEATVRAEKSGQVISVNRALGDFVSAGAVVAEMENASERAAVLQAEGSLDAAKASTNVSQTTLEAAKTGAVNALLTAYATVDEAIRGDADPMFSGIETQHPQLSVPTSEQQARIDAENTRIVLDLMLNRQASMSSSLSVNNNLSAELAQTEIELRQVREFFDDLIVALNAGIATQGISASTIATYKATATAARTTITTSLSAISTAKQGLETAQKNTGATAGPSASSAALKQAEAALAAARANLEKSIIRAPISGTINSLALKRGDYIQATTPVVTVANNGALEVKAYITQSDTARVSVGDPAVLEGGVRGTVTKIAPALDPVTKKIEVRVGLPANIKTLVNGQSVIVKFEKAVTAPTTPVTGPLTIPITALKIGSEEMFVFTLDAEKKLVPHVVEIGTLQGDRVAVISGLTADMEIVTDARGLQPGQVVEVK